MPLLQATAPNAGQDGKGRRQSVSTTGVTGVVDLARQVEINPIATLEKQWLIMIGNLV